MARGTQHDAVYALTSGGGATGGLPQPPNSPPSPAPVTTHTPADAEKTAEKKARGGDVERAPRGSMKRVKVAPDSDCSDAESFAEFSIASTATAAADGASTAARYTPPQQQQRQQPASPVSSSSPSLPVIQRGLRASRIVPVTDAEAAAEEQPRRPPEEEHGAPPSSLFMDDRRRVYPSEQLSNDESQGTRGGLGGDGDSTKEEGARTLIPSRPPPAVTNLDLSSNPVPVSSNSTLPPLELEVAPLPSLPPTPSSPTSGRTIMARKHDGQKAYNPDDDIESNLQGARASGDVGDSGLKASGDSGGGRAPSAVAAPAAVRDKEAAGLKGKISLGRRHAEEMRDRLNRVLCPQGIKITTVMICSTELPSHIAEQMSGRTMNASLAEEQRAVKKSESQKVRHEGEVLELRQRWGIKRSLVLREEAREMEKVRTLWYSRSDTCL